jgi:hypothetical protein
MDGGGEDVVEFDFWCDSGDMAFLLSVLEDRSVAKQSIRITTNSRCELGRLPVLTAHRPCWPAKGFAPHNAARSGSDHRTEQETKGGTGCCATGEPKAHEVVAGKAEVLTAASVTVQADSFRSAVQTQNGIANSDTE